MPTGALSKVPSESNRLRFATVSRQYAWLAVALSFLLFGFVIYWPQIASSHLHESTIVATMFVLIAVSLIASLLVVAFAYRFTIARIFASIIVLMNFGLVAILAFIYWALNYLGIEFTGPG